MSAFFGALGGFSRTFGTTMNSSVQKALFYARARKYGSNLEAALDGPNIPVSVYMRLIEGVNKHLPTFHRYLKLRKRMMRLTDDLHYYDLYAPLVAAVDLHYTPEEAQAHVVTSMAPARRRLHRRAAARVHGSLAGLVSHRRQGVGRLLERRRLRRAPLHPAQLPGQYNDVSTLTHELGHTMHSYYSNKRQPYATANYTTFVAEVASTFNEALLVDHMLKQIKDTPTRLSLLGNYLEGIKSTVFRQTQFAEFELRMHEMAEEGQPITGEALAKAVSRHHAAATTATPTACASWTTTSPHEWSFIPHFYRDFYVFQYATSFRAAEALSTKVLAGDTETRDALPDVPRLGRVEVSDRSAEGRRRGHDHRRAAQADDGADERGDGRDRAALAKAVAVRVRALGWLRLCRALGARLEPDKPRDRATEILFPKRRERQLRGELGGGVAHVQRRVHFDQVERDQALRVGHDLHQQVGFAVVEAAAHRRADARAQSTDRRRRDRTTRACRRCPPTPARSRARPRGRCRRDRCPSS